MELISSLEEMKKWSRDFHYSGKTIGFVPTMGALHEGHISLVKASRQNCEKTVISIFVNPIQFGPHEDYLRYPKSLPKDMELLNSCSADILFVPEAKEMFPRLFQTRVDVENLSKYLCGPFRPGHFRGVATVVLKLFNLVKPHRAYFGEKDYQQLLIVRQMVRDLNLDVEIVPCPIMREQDGLAMSSRNHYLSGRERKAAPTLYASLLAGKEAIRNGEKNPEKICAIIKEKIGEEPLVLVEYVVASNPETLEPLKSISGKTLLALAARIGKTRLIDNLTVAP